MNQLLFSQVSKSNEYDGGTQVTGPPLLHLGESIATISINSDVLPRRCYDDQQEFRVSDSSLLIWGI